MIRPARILPFAAASLLTLAAACSEPPAASGPADKHIRGRIELMTTQKAAMETLEAMMSGRTPFDAAEARAARRTLIQTTGGIRKHFRKPRLEAGSNARPLIWAQWDDFKERAEVARATAKDLNARSLPGLRRTLPAMLQACLSCHGTYRDMPKEFITH